MNGDGLAIQHVIIVICKIDRRIFIKKQFAWYTSYSENCSLHYNHLMWKTTNSIINLPYLISFLTHRGRVTHISVSQLITIVSDNGLWNIVIWTRGKKFQWNLNRNLYIFIQENAFENVVWKMAAILSRPQCVNTWLNHLCEYIRLVVIISNPS